MVQCALLTGLAGLWECGGRFDTLKAPSTVEGFATPLCIAAGGRFRSRSAPVKSAVTNLRIPWQLMPQPCVRLEVPALGAGLWGLGFPTG